MLMCIDGQREGEAKQVSAAQQPTHLNLRRRPAHLGNDRGRHLYRLQNSAQGCDLRFGWTPGELRARAFWRGSGLSLARSAQQLRIGR
jgi:hypothetical protein